MEHHLVRDISIFGHWKMAFEWTMTFPTRWSRLLTTQKRHVWSTEKRPLTRHRSDSRQKSWGGWWTIELGANLLKTSHILATITSHIAILSGTARGQRFYSCPRAPCPFLHAASIRPRLPSPTGVGNWPLQIDSIIMYHNEYYVRHDYVLSCLCLLQMMMYHNESHLNGQKTGNDREWQGSSGSSAPWLAHWSRDDWSKRTESTTALAFICFVDLCRFIHLWSKNIKKMTRWTQGLPTYPGSHRTPRLIVFGVNEQLSIQNFKK